MYRIALLALVMALTGCTNVNQMHKLYQEGDESQLERIMEIVSRPDYPYATRRKAARILGEIGDVAIGAPGFGVVNHQLVAEDEIAGELIDRQVEAHAGRKTERRGEAQNHR